MVRVEWDVVSLKLARATLGGSGALVAQSDDSLESLRQAVTSPGGATASGLAAFSRDFAYGIGPWITTLDEIPSIEGLRGRVRVNGEIRSETRVENFVYTPAELVAYVSIFDGLQPGDLIGSGTMGFGAGVEIDRYLEPGDLVELELEGVGTLRNRLAAEKETPPWWPAPRPYPFEEEESAA